MISFPAWRPTPEQILDLRQAGELLSVALNTLSPSLRMVAWLVDVVGFKLREVAQMLKIAEGTVASRLFRAHARLRADARAALEPAGTPMGARMPGTKAMHVSLDAKT